MRAWLRSLFHRHKLVWVDYPGQWPGTRSQVLQCEKCAFTPADPMGKGWA